MQRREFLLAAGGIVGASSIGAVAFTSASAERDITLDVVADNEAVIGLSGGTLSEIQDDVLVLTDDRDLNSEAEFTYEDAFSITNNDDEERTFDFSATTDEGSATFTLTPDSVTLPATNTENIDITIDTGEGTDDIDGTLRIDVDPQ